MLSFFLQRFSGLFFHSVPLLSIKIQQGSAYDTPKCLFCSGLDVLEALYFLLLDILHVPVVPNEILHKHIEDWLTSIEQINYLYIWLETNSKDLDCPSCLSSGISYFLNKYIREFAIPFTNTCIFAHLTTHQGNNSSQAFLNKKFKCSSHQKNAFASPVSYLARIMPTTVTSH